ncbi:CHASE2 domain-containing protein [Deinococcus metallilatus]|uniref:CHASE2 domain-containing protein n=1 Tax=Deinococcus metallilatus TaxID=1211322 RepID=A0AAJ5F5Z2_9DEIO|nr:CHASE2 domain-containing protein [Deinococcus metallilatus]MBB5294341.1 diguanylate cyclase (GGDEF)-like protein [Deinococcus metallilatus]QBY09111.1 CHASE2 domain-containing protein [Deinococcus metallilatus]RXJ10255.1 CHASE2 domain-containing protein [Deinococcus metallilatus]TLK22547.1 CHASE2 domain-containing protein [Deinococcus metallilatus]GMA16321.1 diguanylate cyclase [Deinococcus metallilatus]
MRTSPERRLTRYALPAALLAAGLALLMPGNGRLWDTLNRALPSPPDPRVVVVGIDDASLRDYGRLSGWPSDLYGQALRTLDEAGAQTIGLDVRLSDLVQNGAGLPGVFSRPNVVLATAPGETTRLPPGWRSQVGVSALNVSPDGRVRSFQTAYPDRNGTLQPSFARQLAVSAGQTVPLGTMPRLLRHVRHDPDRLGAIPFRDVVNGNVRFGDLQGRVVLIGLTAESLPGTARRDADGEVTPGVLLQARAVSTLLGAPFLRLPLWLTLLLCVGVAVLAVMVRGLWGFVIALAALALAVPLWQLNVLFPGVTVSLAAILGTALVGLERWTTLRNLGTRDALTGVGNRLAFTRAVEHRWPGREGRPIGLLLVDLSGFRKVNETYGRAAGDEVLRDLAGRLQTHKRRGDVIFRWGPDEFAVLLDNAGPQDLSRFSEKVQQTLEGLTYRDLPLRASVGGATTGPEIRTPVDLVEAASRSRYRMKYQREQGE